jgi:3-phosphoshikimate 1-carboxyvinyltransferase
VTRFDPAGPLRGTLVAPPDKSISHRAALLGAMADGRSEISPYLDSADTRSTLDALAAVGARVRRRPGNRGGLAVTIEGAGLRGARPSEVDVGNAGTLLRMLPGWLAGQGRGTWKLDGDESIRRRPVDRVAEPLRLMGAGVECRDGRLPPLTVSGSQLRGIDHRLPIASAQVKSCLLLAGLLADGETTVREPAPSRDHTERMLAASGVPIRRLEGGVEIAPVDRLDPGDYEVPGDFSSAAFALAGAVLVADSELRIEGVGLNRSRTGLLSILQRMGAEIEIEDAGDAGPEPVATLIARSTPLAGTAVGPEEVAQAIDELPLVGLLGCFAQGETVVEGAAELRHKESDRIATVVEGLGGLGAEIEARSDGFLVRGTGALRGGRLDAHGDHRLAMLGAIAGLASADGVEVDGSEAAEVSYPGFEADLRSLLSR